MNDGASRRDDDILQAALELDVDERAAYVDAACAEDVEQRDRIRQLIDAHVRAGDFLDRLPVATAPDPWIGAEVGSWRITSLLGEGGAGRVYEAERFRGDFEQFVAVKLLHRGLDRNDDIRRFRTECAALARLDHPNVARIIDSGMVDDHHPYLVMERIEGRPLHEHCAADHLDVEARLRLFLDVCGAVEYAHRNLVIHRDLKPSNILVGRDGRVKLLDFGIAKLLLPDAGDASQTVTRQVRLTPRYASPEQLSGQAIDTLSDVYSLGVLLYELLTDTAPYELEGTTSKEWADVVERTTLTRPSEAVATRPEIVAGSTKGLRRRLRGDLDNIALMALQWDPARRYASPRELADDIRRHLEGLPVRARPDALGYRLGKAVRRYPVATAAAGLAALAIVGALVVGSVSLTNVRNAKLESDRERRTADRTVEFMEAMIASASPDQSQSRETITVLDLLDASDARIEAELADEPVVAARMYRTLARAYEGLQEWESAEVFSRRSLDMHRRLLGPTHRDAVEAANRHASLLARRGDLDGALATVDSVLSQLEDAPESGQLGLLSSRSDLLARRGDFADAIDTGERALAIARDLEDDETLLFVANNVGLAYTRAGRPLESVATFREAVAVADRLRGETHSDTGRMHANLGYSLRAAGRPEEAIPELRRALEIYEAVYEPDHTSVATTRSNLADVLAATGDFEAAIANQRAALAIVRRSLGPDHVNVGHVIHNLGAVYMLQGDYPRAIAALDSGLTIYDHVFGSEHPVVAAALYNKARALRRHGDAEQAQRVADRALEIREASLDADHPDIARSSELMGRLLVDQGLHEEALPWFERSARIRRLVYAVDNMMRIDAERELGQCLTELGRFDEAQACLDVAHEALMSSRGPEHEATVESRQALEALAAARSVNASSTPAAE